MLKLPIHQTNYSKHSSCENKIKGEYNLGGFHKSIGETEYYLAELEKEKEERKRRY